jgi:hypothetical protein
MNSTDEQWDVNQTTWAEKPYHRTIEIGTDLIEWDNH